VEKVSAGRRLRQRAILAAGRSIRLRAWRGMTLALFTGQLPARQPPGRRSPSWCRSRPPTGASQGRVPRASPWREGPGRAPHGEESAGAPGQLGDPWLDEVLDCARRGAYPREPARSGRSWRESSFSFHEERRARQSAGATGEARCRGRAARAAKGPWGTALHAAHPPVAASVCRSATPRLILVMLVMKPGRHRRPAAQQVHAGRRCHRRGRPGRSLRRRPRPMPAWAPRSWRGRAPRAVFAGLELNGAVLKQDRDAKRGALRAAGVEGGKNLLVGGQGGHFRKPRRTSWRAPRPAFVAPPPRKPL